MRGEGIFFMCGSFTINARMNITNFGLKKGWT